MNIDFVEEVNKINKKIEKLKVFISLASEGGFWEEMFVDKRIRLITNVHGFHKKDGGIRLDKELSLKVVELLKEEQHELEVKLKELIKEEANE